MHVMITHALLILIPGMLAFFLVFIGTDKHRLLRATIAALVASGILFGYWWSLFGGRMLG